VPVAKNFPCPHCGAPISLTVSQAPGAVALALQTVMEHTTAAVLTGVSRALSSDKIDVEGAREILTQFLRDLTERTGGLEQPVPPSFDATKTASEVATALRVAADNLVTTDRF
jgi:ABC-type transporter Mla subunit MlaD